jgi:acyl dehydratase
MWSRNDQRGSIDERQSAVLVGREVVRTEWRTVSQEQLDRFHQSVEMTPDATDLSGSANFPDGSRNVDGFMLLSLVQSAMYNNSPIRSSGGYALNYGVDGLRFPSTVYVGDRIRLIGTLAEVRDHDLGVLADFDLVLEHEGHPKPAMVARLRVLHVSG